MLVCGLDAELDDDDLLSLPRPAEAVVLSTDRPGAPSPEMSSVSSEGGS